MQKKEAWSEGFMLCRMERHQEVFETIRKVYGNRVGLGYPKFAQVDLEQLPDLNPCNFFLWGYIKDNCYVGNPKTVPDLVAAIKKIVSNIKDDILKKIFTNFRKRIEFCIDSNGAL